MSNYVITNALEADGETLLDEIERDLDLDTTKFVTIQPQTQKIQGVKTFTQPLTVPTPTLSTHATTKQYVEDYVSTHTGGGGTNAHFETIMTKDLKINTSQEGIGRILFTDNNGADDNASIMLDLDGGVSINSNENTFNVNKSRIINIADAVGDGDAVSKKQLTVVQNGLNGKLDLSGGSVTGNITMNRNDIYKVRNLELASASGLPRILFPNSQKLTIGSVPTGNPLASADPFIHLNDVPPYKIIEVMKDIYCHGNIKMLSNKKITNLPAPTDGGDATNKQYVDNGLSSKMNSTNSSIVLNASGNIDASFNDPNQYSAMLFTPNTKNSKFVLRNKNSNWNSNDGSVSIDFQTKMTQHRDDHKPSGRITSDSTRGSDFQSATLDFYTSLDYSTGGNRGELTKQMSLSREVDVFTTLNMNEHQIDNVGNPSDPQSVATKSYVDTGLDSKLSLGGGTMSGAINLNSLHMTNCPPPVLDDHVATKEYVDIGLWGKVSSHGGKMYGTLDMDTRKIINCSPPDEDTDVANKEYVDDAMNTRLSKAGGTLEGEMDLNGQVLLNCPAPHNPLDVANKRYVDEYVEQQIENIPPPVMPTTLRTLYPVKFSGETYVNNPPYFLRPKITLRPCSKISVALSLDLTYFKNVEEQTGQGYFEVSVFGEYAGSASKRVTISARMETDQYNVVWLRAGTASTIINVDFPSPQTNIYIQVVFRLLRIRSSGSGVKFEPTATMWYDTVRDLFDPTRNPTSHAYDYVSLNNAIMDVQGVVTILD